MVSKHCQNTEKSLDVVFVVKKKTKLDKRDDASIKTFEKDMLFLVSKIDL